MAKVGILHCKNIKNHSCIAYAECFKGMAEKNGEFAKHDEIELVAMTDCGDLLDLCVPRVKLLIEVAGNLERPVDTVHLGNCVKLQMETAECPIDYELKFRTP